MNKPCARGQENRSSDLCAQWKAADAAQESADYTRRGYYIAVAGACIGFLTLAAAAIAAWYARDAAKHTKRSADEAVNANELAQSATEDQERALAIAEISAEAAKNAANAASQQAKALEESLNISKVSTGAIVAVNRGWLSFENVRLEKLVAESDKVHVELSFDIKNRGRSPAHKVNVQSLWRPFGAGVMFLDMENPSPHFPHKDYYWRVDGGDIIFPNEEKRLRNGRHISFNKLDVMTRGHIEMTKAVYLTCDLRVYYNSASALGMTEVRLHIGGPATDSIALNAGEVDPNTVRVITMPGGWAQ